ncbi:MAG: zf-HC2 domain-containing protein [Gemmatimonadales bacterium]
MKRNEMLDCDAVMRLLWDYLDGELTADREAAVRAHLSACKRCYPQYNFELAFTKALVTSRREHSSPEALRSRVLAALRAEGFAA